ncbi:MAG TPA: Gfo/Idh/MocA family oxidoreductase [Armatimonadetes bacterium]|nr:Gfo/Idh/MocA family oxidoreductase [Armatimonadota bacterium]
MDKVRVGIIGCGGIARHAHIPQLQQHPRAEVVWCMDVDRQRAGALAREFGIPEASDDLEGLLALGQADAVTIATPHNAHCAPALRAIEAGLHVCCEKPLALNLEEAQQMTEAAERKGVKTMVCFSYQFVPAARLLKELILRGHLGDLLHVQGYYAQAAALTGAPLVWRFQKAIAGSGALADIGGHVIQLAQWWAGPLVRVCGQLKTFVRERKRLDAEEMAPVEVDDTCSLLGEFAAGGVASITASRAFIGRANYQRFEVSGTEGAAVYDNSRPDSLEVCLGPAFTARRHFVSLPVAPHHRVGQMAHFINGILEDWDRIEPDFRDGLRTQAVLEAVERSVATRRWVRVKQF